MWLMALYPLKALYLPKTPFPLKAHFSLKALTIKEHFLVQCFVYSDNLPLSIWKMPDNQ